jgi:hypothetical protein
MQMRMIKQVLPPTVKYSEEADLRGQMSRAFSFEPLPRPCPPWLPIPNKILVLVSDGSNLFGNREDDMKIRDK